jgi:hypothetical protein
MAIAYEMPKSPSSQLKTVLRYLDLIKVLDLDELDKLFAVDFVQSTLPLSLGVPSRTKEEDIGFLRALGEKLEKRQIEVSKVPGPSAELLSFSQSFRVFFYRLPCMT